MGGTESQNQQACQDLLADFNEIRREPNGLVLSQKKSQNTYFLKEFNFVNKKQYETEFKRLQGLESQPQNDNILPLVRLFSQTFNNICSNSYKIYALYEYPTITLEEEIVARRKQNKYFDECELWSILQSCANALGELKPSLSLHPKNIFIVPDGVLKVTNNEMIDQDYRCYLKEGIYYAPQKIRQFKRNDNENSLRKQCIFSLGMTLLHAALLTPVNDCYNYQNFQFHEDQLEKHIQVLVSAQPQSEQQSTQRGRYSQEFIQMLAMILEPNPNKRASLMQVHGMLTKVWNTQTDEQNIKNDIEQNEQQETNRNIIVSQSATLKNSKRQALQRSTGSELVLKQEQKSNLKASEVKQASQAENVPRGVSESRSYMSSFHQSQRQSKPNLNEINAIININPKPLQFTSIPQYQAPIPSYIPPPSSTYLYTPPSLLGTNKPSLGLSANKENGLYTDPKLLQMIRKDLQDLNQLKKSSMMNTYGAYSNGYLGTSSYYSSYGDIGAGMFSSKTSLGLPTQNNQQVYTVNTQTNYLSQRQENLTVPSLKTQVSKQSQPQPQKQAFSKQNSNQVFVVEEYEDGRKFEGTLVNGFKEGRGKLIYSDGAYYEGDFKNDKMEGQGTLFYGPDRPAYEGQWLSDQFHGFGILYNENPLDLNGCFNYNDFNLIEDFWVRYQGNFDCDNKSGEGKLILSNGEQFQGHFQNDCINGKGIFLTKQGQEITGLWEQNILVQLDA